MLMHQIVRWVGLVAAVSRLALPRPSSVQHARALSGASRAPPRWSVKSGQRPSRVGPGLVQLEVANQGPLEALLNGHFPNRGHLDVDFGRGGLIGCLAPVFYLVLGGSHTPSFLVSQPLATSSCERTGWALEASPPAGCTALRCTGKTKLGEELSHDEGHSRISMLPRSALSPTLHHLLSGAEALRAGEAPVNKAHIGEILASWPSHQCMHSSLDGLCSLELLSRIALLHL